MSGPTLRDNPPLAQPEQRDTPLDLAEDHRLGRLPDPQLKEEAVYYEGVTFRRFIAWIIDSILIAILVMVLLPFTAFSAVFFLPVFWLVIGFAYRVLTLWGGSATWGMRMVGIELRAEDGTRFDLGLGFLHTLFYSISMAFFIVQVGSIICMLISPRGQGLHDLLLSTAAIKRG